MRQHLTWIHGVRFASVALPVGAVVISPGWEAALGTDPLWGLLAIGFLLSFLPPTAGAWLGTGALATIARRSLQGPPGVGRALLDLTLLGVVLGLAPRLSVPAAFWFVPTLGWLAARAGARRLLGVTATAMAMAAIGVWHGGHGAIAMAWLPVALLALCGGVLAILGSRMHRARLVRRELERARRDLEAVVTVTRAFAATLDTRAILAQVIHSVNTRVGAFRCCIAQVDDGPTGAVDARATLLISREMMAQPGPPHGCTLEISLADYPEMTAALHTGDLVVVQDVANDTLMAPVATRLQTLGIRALLCVPLTLDDPVTGTLLLCMARRTACFSPRDLRWCTLIAAAAAAPLRNAAVHEGLAERNVSLEEMVVRDPLTGLYNRRFLEIRLSEEVRLAQRHGVPLSLLMFDIDHFKRVNDTHGHPVGDDVLARIGAVVAPRLRKSDCFARCGGEEFAVLLPLTDGEGARATAEEVRRAIATLAVRAADMVVSVTVSVGVSTYEVTACPDVEALVVQADGALYAAKRAGRDGVRCAWELPTGVTSKPTSVAVPEAPY